MNTDFLRNHRLRAKKLRLTYDTRTANCLAAIGIYSVEQVKNRVTADGTDWLDKIPSLGEVSKVKILRSIGITYRKKTPLDKAIALIESKGYIVTSPTNTGNKL